MRVDFIGHATLLVRHGALTLLTDPWWSGPAYAGQWYPYPRPVPERFDLRQVDAVYISHAHEDHLHAATLKQLLELAPNAEALIPLRYDGQMRDYVKRIGFRRIREVFSGMPFWLRKNGSRMRLTVMTHMDDSLLAVEADGEVMLNLNDALHASTREMIDEYCRILRRRFPRIDYLFCGFGGASYFPNCFHVDGKDDVAVARTREEFFLQNFAHITQRLRPRLAFPFAAHFVLPDEHAWWISAQRLAGEPPSATIRRYLPPSEAGVVHDLQPGDYVQSGRIYASPPPEPGDVDAVRRAVLEWHPRPTPAPLEPAAFEALRQLMQDRLSTAALERSVALDAVVRLWDFPSRALAVHVANGSARVEAIEPADIARRNPQFVFDTWSDLLRRTIRSPFGRDLISVGYGAEVHIRSRQDLDGADNEPLLSLLAPPQPRWRERLRKDPLRTLGFIVGDPSMRFELASHVPGIRRGAAQTEPGLYHMRDWFAGPNTSPTREVARHV